MKKVLVCLALVLGAVILNAAEYSVSSAGEVAALQLKAGDIVTFKNGTYADQNIVIKGNGTAENPIVFQGEEAGKVIFTGKSTLSANGAYLVIKDFYFKDPATRTGSLIELKTTDSRLTNCAITGWNTVQDPATDSKWVSLYKERNRVDHCWFDDKRNIGCLLVVWLEKDVVPNHTIEHNYFSRPKSLLDPDGGKSNGQECIRIGTSDYSMQRADCNVKSNYFYRCDGEIEVISNKSCFNTFSGNLFEECGGALTLRHGNNGIVERNYFLGNGVAGTGGIRVIGDHQLLKNNYFENLEGTKYLSAICLIQGVANSPLNRYFQVTDSDIEGNTIVNCRNGIAVSYGQSEDQSLPVISTVIARNAIYNDGNKNLAILYFDAPGGKTDVTWKDNIVHGGTYQGIMTAEVPMTRVKPSLPDVQDACWVIRKGSGVSWNVKR